MKWKTEKNSREESMKPKTGSLIKTQAQTDHAEEKSCKLPASAERGDITTDPTHITKTTKGYYKQFYHTNSTADMRWTNFLKITNYQSSPKPNWGNCRASISGNVPGLYSGPACSQSAICPNSG